MIGTDPVTSTEANPVETTGEAGAGQGCVVISGAGGDIGRAIALRFAQRGRSLALLDRNEEALCSLSRDVKEAGARRVGTYIADQTDKGAVDCAVDQAADDLGELGVLVATAGYARQAPFLDMPEKIWARHVDVNLNGTFFTCQALARKMVQQRTGGSIVIISSCLALFHTDQTGAYSATKAALLMLTKTMAAELGVYRIRTNAILPGVVETAMTRTVLQDSAVRDNLLAETPVGRLGSPEDIAAAVEFLAGPSASFITGATLLVDGGQSIYGQPQWIRQDRSTPFEPTWHPAAK